MPDPKFINKVNAWLRGKGHTRSERHVKVPFVQVRTLVGLDTDTVSHPVTKDQDFGVSITSLGTTREQSKIERGVRGIPQ